MTISDVHLECRAEEAKLHDRIAELEQENQRLQGLYDDAMARLEAFHTPGSIGEENQRLREQKTGLYNEAEKLRTEVSAYRGIEQEIQRLRDGISAHIEWAENHILCSDLEELLKEGE